MNKAILFDRDGVINIRPVKDYVKSPEEFHFMPDFLKFFKWIKEKNYTAIVITNQQGVGKGLMTEDELTNVHSYMQIKLKELTGFYFDDIYFCTDLSDSGSKRRKPETGMIDEAVEKWGFDRSSSWMIGDSKNDVIAGKRAGLRTIFLANHLTEPIEQADFVFKNLIDAMNTIEV